MSIKKPSLSAVLHAASGKKPIATIVEVAPVLPKKAKKEDKASIQPPSRNGKKIISGHFDPAVSRQLKQIALDRDQTVQTLLSEALNDLFVKYNQKPIA